jgi:hypothetical protein
MQIVQLGPFNDNNQAVKIAEFVKPAKSEIISVQRKHQVGVNFTVIPEYYVIVKSDSND